jgi:hypothetical protein
MLGHQSGQDLVLGLDFLLQELDRLLLLLDLTGATLLHLERGGSVLKKLFRPAIEDSRLWSIFLTNGNLGLKGVASGWLLSLLRCSACALFSYVLSAILAKERLLHFQLRRDSEPFRYCEL